MSTSLFSVSISEPEPQPDHLICALHNRVNDQPGYSPQIFTDWEGEDLEIILSESDDQLRPPPPSKRRKRKKTEPSTQHSRPDSIPFPLSVTMSDKVLGQMAPRQQLFCLFQAVSKYPYRYVKRSESDAVSKTYFAGGKLRARGWSIYYINTTLDFVKPLLLVPAIEFRALLAEINGSLDLQLKFPDNPAFSLSFLEEGSPRPRYLGCLSVENSLELLESQMPEPDFTMEGEDVVDPRSLEAFRKKIEATMEATKHRSKGTKEKRKKVRVMEKKSCCLQLRRTQRYLGMKPVLINPHTEVLEWAELQEASRKYEEANAKSYQLIDMARPVPYAFDQEVVFVAIDVEWYERSHKAITEIGISTLDTLDLANIPPGEGCLSWMEQIRARHFRIKEHSHLINSDFVAGCGDRFEAAFGTSEWISIQEAPQVVASCFRFGSISASDDLDASSTSEQCEHEFPGPPSSSSISGTEHATDDHDEAKPKRNIILVGHDIKSDVDQLRAIGFDVTNVSNILEIIDTADIFRALKHEQQPRSLGVILLDLGLTGWNLHNAGNDAAYTLQVMLGVSFKALDASRERRAAIAAARAIRIEEAAKEAQQHIRDDFDEWDMVDNEDQEGASEATDGLGSKKSKDILARSVEADAGPKAGEKVVENRIAEAEAEAERLALAAGDDIGDDERSHTGGEKRTMDHNDGVLSEGGNNITSVAAAHENDIQAANHLTSNRNSRSSSINLAHGNDDAPLLSDQEDITPPGGNDDKSSDSPLGPQFAARLRFLDAQDGDVDELAGEMEIPRAQIERKAW